MRGGWCAVPPKVLHYGLDWKIGNTGYEFDKHWFYDFDALQCPPWNLSTDRSTGGLFKHPPHPSLYPTKVMRGPYNRQIAFCTVAEPIS